MARVRTQKAVASRIDLNYHAKPHPWRRLRVVLVTLCTLAAVGWFAWSSVRITDGRLTLVDTIHNPGPVTGAHAMFENKCIECHDGGGNGARGYWLNVSDNACLKCHDGSLHHANQKTAETHAGVSLASHTLAVKDADHPFKARSASCISCHTEHRGHEGLAASSDQHCTTCHANLDGKVREGAPTVARQIATFSRDGTFREQDHPRFGRELGAGGAWKDNTQLKFGHARHAKVIHASMQKALGLPPSDKPDYLGRDCLTCHSVLNPQPVRRDLSKIDRGEWESTPPPYWSADDRPADAINSSDLSYMQQVSYAQHCVACHTIDSPPKKARELPREKPGIAKADFAHEDLSIVRGQVAALVQASLVAFEDSMKAPAAPAGGGGRPGAAPPGPGARPGAQPKEEAQPKPDPAPPARPGARPGATPARPGAQPAAEEKPVELNAAEWTRLQLTLIATEANAALSSIDGYTGKKLEIPPKPTGGTTQPSIDPAILVDYYTTLLAVKNCYTCHTLAGELPTLDAAKNAAMTNRLRTVATGIPKSPRRWFPASRFDHYAHRAVDCRSCHAPAWQSGPTGQGGADAMASTAHVLTVDIDGSYPAAAGLTVGASSQSCVSCHHSGTSEMRGAPANCITCHEYHDHALERPIDGMLRTATPPPPPSTQPAAPVAWLR